MKRTAAVGLVLVLAGAVAWWWLHDGRERDLVVSGTVETRAVRVGSLLGGRVKSVEVEEGQRVRSGEPLLEFESELAERQVEEQEASLAEARAVLDKSVAGPRREELSRARLEWSTAEATRLRDESLLRDGVISQQQYDVAAAEAGTLLETLKELEAGSRSEDTQQAAAVVREAEARLAYLKRQLEEAIVRAPVDAVVETLDLQPGDLVPANRPVAMLLESTKIWVRIYIPETELGRVQIGQKARIEVDSFPDREFSGTLTELSEQGEYTPRNLQTRREREEQMFAGRVRLEAAPELKAGMAATVSLVEAPGPGR